MAKVKKTFKLRAKLKDCPEVFMDGESAGVIAVRETEFELDEEVYDTPRFLATLIDLEAELMKGCVETNTEEVK